jgi:ATP-dependent Clp protease ATP-binding subunit ClpA
MFEHLTKDARRQVLTCATEEAKRRGDRRIGTDHLLLGLLDDPSSVATRILGVDLVSARASADALDRAALASIGIDVGDRPPSTPARTRRRPPFTSGARAALKSSVDEAIRHKKRRIESHHLLLALLSREQPDPAAQLLETLGVDRAAARDRLQQSAG